VGTDIQQPLQCGRNTTPPCHKVAALYYVKLAEMTLEINLYELMAPFECFILETERMETQGNCLRFWYRKCIKWVKELFRHQLLLLLRREIFLWGDALTVQHVTLIKSENFGAFLSWLLRQENTLTRDVLNEFYCMSHYSMLPTAVSIT
jgi:hypothetical protein